MQDVMTDPKRNTYNPSLGGSYAIAQQSGTRVLVRRCNFVESEQVV